MRGDRRFRFEDQHLAPGQRELACDRESHDAGPDDDAIYLLHGALSTLCDRGPPL